MAFSQYSSIRKAALSLRSVFLNSAGSEGQKRSARIIDIKRELDDDGNGEIDVEELRNHVNLLDVTPLVVEALVSAIDIDGDETITTRELRKFVFPPEGTREFAVILHAVRRTVLSLVANAAAEGTEDSLLKAFAKLGGGLVRRHQLDHANVRLSLKALELPDIGEGSRKLNDMEVDTLIESLDRNHDGVVSTHEFKAWIVPKRSRAGAIPTTGLPTPSPVGVKEVKAKDDSSKSGRPSPKKYEMPQGWSPKAPERISPIKKSALSPVAPVPVPTVAKTTVVKEKVNYKGKEFQEHVRKAAREVARKEIGELNVQTGTVKAEVYSLQNVSGTIRHSIQELRKDMKKMQSAVGSGGRKSEALHKTVEKCEKKLASLAMEMRRLDKANTKQAKEVRDFVKKEIHDLAKDHLRIGKKASPVKKQGAVGAKTPISSSSSGSSSSSKSKDPGLHDEKPRIRKARQRPPPKVIRQSSSSQVIWRPSASLFNAHEQIIKANASARARASGSGSAGANTLEPRSGAPPKPVEQDPKARKEARTIFHQRLAESVGRWEGVHRREPYDAAKAAAGRVGPRWKGPLYERPRGVEEENENCNDVDNIAAGEGSPQPVYSTGRPRVSPVQKDLHQSEKGVLSERQSAQALEQRLQEELDEAMQACSMYVSEATSTLEVSGSLDMPMGDWWEDLQARMASEAGGPTL